MYYWNYGIHTTCLYLFEALSGFYASSHPRLRSLSLGLLKSVPLLPLHRDSEMF